MTVLLWALGNKKDQRGRGGQNTDESKTLNLCFLSLLFQATRCKRACMRVRESCGAPSKMENRSPFSLWNTLRWIIFSSFIMLLQTVGWGLCVGVWFFLAAFLLLSHHHLCVVYFYWLSGLSLFFLSLAAAGQCAAQAHRGYISSTSQN